MYPHKVLLIDDSAVTLQVIAEVLARAGYDVRTATEVIDVASAHGEWRPDIILTDVNMPGVSGVELCRRLKSSYETAHVPVVLYSALAADDLEVLARECEADAFLSKSSDIEELPKALAALIETSLF
jgi:CheY-like chemotaxis protein